MRGVASKRGRNCGVGSATVLKISCWATSSTVVCLAASEGTSVLRLPRDESSAIIKVFQTCLAHGAKETGPTRAALVLAAFPSAWRGQSVTGQAQSLGGLILSASGVNVVLFCGREGASVARARLAAGPGRGRTVRSQPSHGESGG